MRSRRIVFCLFAALIPSAVVSGVAIAAPPSVKAHTVSCGRKQSEGPSGAHYSCLLRNANTLVVSGTVNQPSEMMVNSPCLTAYDGHMPVPGSFNRSFKATISLGWTPAKCRFDLELHWTTTKILDPQPNWQISGFSVKASVVPVRSTQSTSSGPVNIRCSGPKSNFPGTHYWDCLLIRPQSVFIQGSDARDTGVTLYYVCDGHPSFPRPVPVEGGKLFGYTLNIAQGSFANAQSCKLTVGSTKGFSLKSVAEKRRP